MLRLSMAQAATCGEKVYRGRHPERTVFYSVLFHHFDRFVGEYDLRFEREYGKWRPVIQGVVEKYFDCGNLKNGFARIRCASCKSEYLLAFSCKGRGFCPSCSAKRSVMWGEFIRTQVLADVPHRHLVFSIPKLLRGFFKHNRKLLTELSRCGWRSIRDYLDIEQPGGEPAAIISIQTAGDFLNWNPHLHSLAASGTFREDGSFEPVLLIQENILRELFEAHVFKLLLAKGLITRELFDKMRTWRHSGFHVHAGPALTDIHDAVRVGLYIVRPPASAGRLQVADDPGWLKYLAKGSQPHPYSDSLFEPQAQVFDYLDWIARLTSHIPDKGAQSVHYYGGYSNVSRGKRRKAQKTAGMQGQPRQGPTVSADESESDWVKDRRKSWAALIKLIFEVDPLLCPGCRQPMQVIAFIREGAVIDKILSHLHYRFEVLALPQRAPPVSPALDPDNYTWD